MHTFEKEILHSFKYSLLAWRHLTDKKHPRTLRGGRSGLASGERGFEVAFISFEYLKNRLSSRASVMMCWVGHELGGQTSCSEQENVIRATGRL